MNLIDTATDITLDDQGRLIGITGVCKARDFKKKMVVEHGNRTKQ